MRTIVAKWTQPCRACGKPVMYDTEAIYDDTTKRIYHEACAPVEQVPGQDSASVELARRLGYRTSDEWAAESEACNEAKLRTSLPYL